MESDRKKQGSSPRQFGKAAFSRAERLRLWSEFEYVHANGRRFHGRLFVLTAAPSPDGTLRCGFICGRRTSPDAVGRNRARRLLKESFRLVKSSLLPSHIILSAKREILSSRTQEVQDELIRISRNAGIWVR